MLYPITTDGNFIGTGDSSLVVLTETMATTKEVAEAIRSVLLSNAYRQSRNIGAFDTGNLHKQFFFDGPRTVEPSMPGQRWAHTRWEMTVNLLYSPRTNDPDHGRFDFLGEVDGLIEAWGEDSTIRTDEFSVEVDDPQWLDEPEAWVVPVRCQWLNTRTFS